MLFLDRGECHRGRTPGHPEAESVESTAPRSWGASQVKGLGPPVEGVPQGDPNHRTWLVQQPVQIAARFAITI